MANGDTREFKSLYDGLLWEVAKNFRLSAKMPIAGDLINEKNYDLKNI